MKQAAGTALAALIALAAASCDAPRYTTLEVAVATSYVVPSELDRVELTVTVGSRSLVDRTMTLTATTPAPYEVVVWREANDEPDAAIVARGFLGSTMVVETAATTTFRAFSTRRVELELSAACHDVRCDRSSCRAGVCVDDAGVVDGGVVDGGVVASSPTACTRAGVEPASFDTGGPSARHGA